MKKRVLFRMCMMLLAFAGITMTSSAAGKDSLKVVCSPDLLGISRAWAAEYNSSAPETPVSIVPFTGALEEGTIGIVNDRQELTKQQVWKLVVGRDVVVPVINSENPFIGDITVKGIKRDALAALMGNKERTWGSLLGNDNKKPVNIFMPDDEALAETLAGFLGAGIGTIRSNYTHEDIIDKTGGDPYAIGFSRLSTISGTAGLPKNIRLLPLDKNANGSLDFTESFYEDVNVFSRGVWIGKYPKSLFHNIYTVSVAMPEKAGIDFIKWIISDGQALLADNNLSGLIAGERSSALDKLVVPAGIPQETGKAFSPVLTAAIIIAILIAGLFAFEWIPGMRLRRSPVTVAPVVPSVLSDRGVLVPGGLFFDKGHIWAFMEQNGLARVGIDDFLQHLTGQITRLKARKPGEKIKKGDIILSVSRNGKQLNLYSPVSGVIKEYNNALDSNASLINSSPYDKGWVYRIEPVSWLADMSTLLMSKRYGAWLKGEIARIKDFLASALRTDEEHYAMVILQDGGELADSTLAELGPEIWDDFQTNFIDAARKESAQI